MSKSAPSTPIEIQPGTAIGPDGRIMLPTCSVPESVELVPVEIPPNARTVDLDKLLEGWSSIQTESDQAPLRHRAIR